MSPADSLAAWLRSAMFLAGLRDLPMYRRLSWLARRRADIRALAALVVDPESRPPCLCGVLLAVLARVIAWELDLEGWIRAGVLIVPALAVGPALAAGHRRHLCRVVRAGRSGGRSRAGRFTVSECDSVHRH